MSYTAVIIEDDQSSRRIPLKWPTKTIMQEIDGEIVEYVLVNKTLDALFYMRKPTNTPADAGKD